MRTFLVNRRTLLATLGTGLAALRLSTRRWLFVAASTAPDVALDPLRPEYHLMPPHNWMNDPNGPIWWKGKYHLFYQLNPHASVWGDMHWGHAVSTDMVHWRHQPVALAPTPGGHDSEGCFSGSSVAMDGVVRLLYTGVANAPPGEVTLHDGTNRLRETQMLATADDDTLLRWTKAPQPVIGTPPEGVAVTGFRDPCAWREPDAWYLGIASGERGKGGCVLLYRSQDLRHWEYLGKLAEGRPNGKIASNPCDSAEMWECPDFFELNGRHCLLYSTAGKVFWSIGIYDKRNHRFTPQHEGVLDHGAYYAPKSFLAPDGRRILWGWIEETRPQAEFAVAGWAGVMSMPRALNVGKQGQLEIAPAAEVENLRGSLERATAAPDKPYRLNLSTLRHELFVPISFSSGKVGVSLFTGGERIWELTVDVTSNEVRRGDLSFPLPSRPWPRPSVRLFFDGSVIESFICGREAFTSRVYSILPGKTTLEVGVTGPEGVALVHWPLAAISPNRLTT
jgi:beta-fructofuranosidase